MTTATIATPAIVRSGTRGSIAVEPLTCTIGALISNVNLGDASRDPEYQVRFRWRTNSMAIWDNRCTQHYAVQDYWPAVRKLERAGIIGDRPY